MLKKLIINWIKPKNKISKNDFNEKQIDLQLGQKAKGVLGDLQDNRITLLNNIYIIIKNIK